MQPAPATVANYLLKGIETGLLEPAAARAWADSHVERAELPDYEFIELALSRSTEEVVACLRSFIGNGEPELAGKWLLYEVAKIDFSSTQGLAAALGKALQVVRHTNMSDDVYYEFDGLTDELFLARHGELGTVEDCRKEFQSLLLRHAQQALTSSGA
jgi:hypothetical protein